uniref:Uncharacterized protein n=1 Tax=Chromera velia CCMP2878 TaxID=1169474 RepID=A0A0G4HGV3_9ALVE|eukprot:Cvel_27459.t1-p1 / transcript=Cvel_27459.t1 / gene=Cvel_27459 / organism=Chromera_velia_CCMP2878 / gene_product=hypothetical protein / transcript_product=hypothetical protein / location=Cvel_scaffold3429:938-1829(-) / protein_length=205 / sequence_SO=supercontig / SO=protein_coding / is_pseudo=false
MSWLPGHGPARNRGGGKDYNEKRGGWVEREGFERTKGGRRLTDSREEALDEGCEDAEEDPNKNEDEEEATEETSEPPEDGEGPDPAPLLLRGGRTSSRPASLSSDESVVPDRSENASPATPSALDCAASTSSLSLFFLYFFNWLDALKISFRPPKSQNGTRNLQMPTSARQRTTKQTSNPGTVKQQETGFVQFWRKETKKSFDPD